VYLHDSFQTVRGSHAIKNTWRAWRGVCWTDVFLCPDHAQDPGDGSLIRALGDIARARGMTQLARDTGLTREGLYKALSTEGNPAFPTIFKVIRALGSSFMQRTD